MTIFQIALVREAAAMPVFSGVLNPATSPSAANRLTRNGIVSACGTNKPFPGTQGGGPFFFATGTYTHRGAATCVTFTLSGSCGINAFGSAYSGAFSTANLGQNYLGDAGLSGPTQSFGIQMTPGQTVTLVVNSVGAPPAGGCTFEFDTDQGLPTDSLNARAIQNAITPIVAQASGAAISSAVDTAIHDAFTPGGGQPFAMSPGGMRFNFAGEEQERSRRIDEATNAMSYAGITKAPPAPALLLKDWSAWVDVRGTGWKIRDSDNAASATGTPVGNINGSQVNATAGIGRLLNPDLLVGVLAGTEYAKYDVNMLGGGLKGQGGTIGAYAARRLGDLRFDGALAWSRLNFDVNTATALASSGSFSANRWFGTAGVTGTYRWNAYALEPSARLYLLREHENDWTDSLGTLEPTRDFTTGRVSVGSKVARGYEIASGAKLVPYVGLYADYVFLSDNAVPVGSPVTTIQSGFAARTTGGLRYIAPSGASVTAGGELGGLGANYLVLVGSVSATLPF